METMDSLISMMQVSSVQILDKEIPLYFSIFAAMRMEEALGMRYPAIIARLFEQKKEDSEERYEPLSLKEQVRVAAVVAAQGERMKSGDFAGFDWRISEEKWAEFFALLRTDDFNRLALAVTMEMLRKSSRGKQGNA